MDTPREIFDDIAYLRAFEDFRRISHDVLVRYVEYMHIKSGSQGTLLDLGAGPGIQTESLVQHMPSGWKFVLVEPSKELLAAAQGRLGQSSKMKYINCQLGGLDISVCADVIWISEVAHLLGQPKDWLLEIAQHTNPGATILIRTSTHAQLANREWYRFFPRALSIDVSRHPSEREVSEAMTLSGAKSAEVITIDESRTVSANHVISMFERKAFSTLHMLTEHDFKAGMEQLRASLKGKDTTHWDYQMTAYVARYE